MAHRCRTCGLRVPVVHASLPNPDLLVPLEPYLGTLIDAAAEYDSIDPTATTAVEFVRWLGVDIQHATGYQYGRRSMAGPQR